MTQYRVLISAPGDVIDEVPAIDEVFLEFNATAGDRAGVNLRPVYWRRDGYPEMGNHPQEIINRQLVDGCDAVIAVFWTRFGSPTENYGSGTEEEINRLLDQGKQVFLYFSDAPIPPSAVDQEQYERVQRFKERCRTRGLYCGYESVPQFRDLLRRHLEAYFIGRLQAGRASHLSMGCYDGTNVCDTLVLHRSSYSQSEYVNGMMADAAVLATKLMTGPGLPRYDDIADGSMAALISSLVPERYVLAKDTVDRVTQFCKSRNITISDESFGLGDLRKSCYSLSILGGGPDLVGTDEEKGRLQGLLKLDEAIARAQCMETYLGQFDAMHTLRLLVSNSGTSVDRNIDVDVFVPKGAVAKLHNLPTPGMWCVDIAREIVEWILTEQETYRVKVYPDYADRAVVPADIPFRLTQSAKEQYDRSLSRYHADVDRLFAYVLFEKEGFDVVHTQISYLKHNESVFLPMRLFLREAVMEIAYEIRSENCATTIRGRISKPAS